MKKKTENPKKPDSALSRREFLKSASIAATMVASVPAAFGPFSIITRKAYAQPPTDQVKVIVARDTATYQGSTIYTDQVKLLMDESIRRFTNIFNTGEAYKSVFPRITQESVIGIKVNCINYSLPTHPQVVDALINGLLEMRVEGQPFPANNIIIWDRTNADLVNSGYTINTGTEGVRCFGTNEPGVGFSETPLYCEGSPGSTQHPSRILTDYIDYHINFAVFKNAGGCGLTMSLKNNYGCVDAPWNMHGNACDPYIAALNAQIRDVLGVQESLFIVDSIFGCYSGGPAGSPNMEYGGIILGQDRVAVDSIGRTILEEYGCPTLANSFHVDTAASAAYNLGINDLEEIHRIDVENPSIPVENVRVRTEERDVYLSWGAPEYTGKFKILRSGDPGFSNPQEIAITSSNQFVHHNAVGTAPKSFYRVVKTW